MGTAPKSKSKPIPTKRRNASRRSVRNAEIHHSKALVIRPPDPKPWLLTQDEVSILKNAVCKGASDEELKYCLTVARRYELDPFQKQIWFVPRWDSEASRTDGKKGAIVYTPQVSIDGLQHQAASHHADYGSFSEIEYGPMLRIEWHYQDDDKAPAQYIQAPEWARVEAWKKGAAQPTVGKVWWEEIYPKVGRAPLVRRMPRLMLGKCAKAQAIRAAYPKKTGGLYIPEESYGREFQDITPGGRIITQKEEFTPNEQKYLDRLTPEQREVEQAAMRNATKVQPTAELGTLTYGPTGEVDQFTVNGPQSLLTEHREVLTRYWNPKKGAIVLTGEELESLKYHFQQKGVQFKPKAVK